MAVVERSRFRADHGEKWPTAPPQGEALVIFRGGRAQARPSRIPDLAVLAHRPPPMTAVAAVAAHALAAAGMQGVERLLLGGLKLGVEALGRRGVLFEPGLMLGHPRLFGVKALGRGQLGHVGVALTSLGAVAIGPLMG